MWIHTKKSMKRLKRPNSLFLRGEVSSAVLKTWKTRKTKTWITQIFQILYAIQGTTMLKLTSWGFRKCCTFWVHNFLKGSYWPLQKIRGVAKKRHGHNNEFWGLKRIAGPPNHVRRPCYSFQDPQIDIVAVSFFCDASFPAKNFSEFDLTLTAYNYGLKPLNLKLPHFRNALD